MTERHDFKRVLAVTITGVILVLLIPVCFSSRESRIVDFVMEHQSELEAIALRYMDGDRDIEEYKGIAVDGVFHDIVQFTDYNASIGIAPASKYYGFYYAKDHLPSSYQDAEIPLEEISEQEWKWSDGQGNGGITKHITGNWYYYEAWF